MALKLGTAIQKLSLGSAAVKAAYLGTSLVYSSTSASAVSTIAQAPVVTAASTYVTVSWTRTWGDATAGRNVLIAKSTNGGASWDSPLILPDRTTFTSTTVAGLTNGTAYVFRLGLSVSSGDYEMVTWGPQSPPITPTAAPVVLPDAPLNLRATTNSDGYIDVTWSGAAGNNYLLEYTTSVSNTVKWLSLAAITAPATSYRLQQGIDGQRYYFRAASVNSAGISTFTTNWSGSYEASAVFGKKTAPLDPPGVPVAYSFSNFVGQTAGARVTCTPPSRNGNDFAGSSNAPANVYLWYELQLSSNNGSTWTTVPEGAGYGLNWANTVNPITAGVDTSMFGLTPGTTYVFRARAVNTVGPGPYSAKSNSFFTPVWVN